MSFPRTVTYGQRERRANPGPAARIAIRLAAIRDRLHRDLPRFARSSDALATVSIQDALDGIDRAIDDCKQLTGGNSTTR